MAWQISNRFEPEYLIGFYQHNKRSNGFNFVFYAKVQQEGAVTLSIDETDILAAHWLFAEEFEALDREQVLNPNKHERILHDLKAKKRIDLDHLSPIIRDVVYN